MTEEKRPLYIVSGYSDGHRANYSDKDEALAEAKRLTQLPRPKIGTRVVTLTEERILFAWSDRYFESELTPRVINDLQLHSVSLVTEKGTGEILSVTPIPDPENPMGIALHIDSVKQEDE